MKKLLCSLLIISALSGFLLVQASNETDAAWFLAYQWIIAAQDDTSEYRVENNITRREMFMIYS